MEAGAGEATGRRYPGIGNRPLDERVSRPMPGRPIPCRDIAQEIGRVDFYFPTPLRSFGMESKYSCSFRTS
jgi:hypothetical protein